MKNVRPSLLVVMALTACLAVPVAQASTVGVGTCPQSYITFTTIQAAITAVPPGSVIKICPGTYAEQLLITKKLTDRGDCVGWPGCGRHYASGGWSTGKLD